MIIGITGTNGAGKGTVVEYLKTKWFIHFSARTFFIEEIKRRGLPINRDTITEVANDLRVKFGTGYFTEQALARLGSGSSDAVIESIRTPGEAEYLKAKGALLWAVDADIHTRYDHAILRGSETDKISFEKFVADEQREWSNDDPTKQNLKAVIDTADVILTNNGTQEELFAQVEAALHDRK